MTASPLSQGGIADALQTCVKSGCEIDGTLPLTDGFHDVKVEIGVRLKANGQAPALRGALTDFRFGLLNLLPKRGVSLLQRDGVGFKLALGFLQVPVDLRLVIEVEGDR